MASFSVLELHPSSNDFINNIITAIKTQSKIYQVTSSQENLQSKHSLVAPVTPIPRTPLQSISFNRRSFTDIDSSPLPSAKRVRLTTSEPNIRGRKLLSARAAPESNIAPVSPIASQSIRTPVEVPHPDSITHAALAPLKGGGGRPPKAKSVKQIKETKGKKEKKENKRDKKNNTDTKDTWSKKETTKPTRKSAREMEDAKNIRFGTVEQKQARERTDKEHRLARQRARALRKGDTPSSSLALPAQLVDSTPHPQDKKSGRYRTCVKCEKAKALTQFLSDELNDEYRSFCLHCLTDDANNADETV